MDPQARCITPVRSPGSTSQLRRRGRSGGDPAYGGFWWPGRQRTRIPFYDPMTVGSKTWEERCYLDGRCFREQRANRQMMRLRSVSCIHGNLACTVMDRSGAWLGSVGIQASAWLTVVRESGLSITDLGGHGACAMARHWRREWYMCMDGRVACVSIVCINIVQVSNKVGQASDCKWTRKFSDCSRSPKSEWMNAW